MGNMDIDFTEAVSEHYEYYLLLLSPMIIGNM